MTEEILKKVLTSEHAIAALGIPAKVIRRPPWAMEVIRMRAYIVAADSLESDADFKAVFANAGTDEDALRYSAERITVAARTLLEGLVK